MKSTIITTILACSALLSSCASSGSASASSANAKPYPKNTCIVTDNRLGSMGRPITEVYNGQEIKFCCKPCIAKFHANPQKYLSKIQ